MSSYQRIFLNNILNLIPLLFLLFLSFSETSFQFEELSFFSFNMIHIIIFYWVLKNPEILGYGFIFMAGIINDVVVGLPIGVSSITYLILAGFAAYIRNLTVQPSLLYDCIVFIPSLAVTNSIYYYILTIFFEIDLDYFALASNTGITIILYPIVGILFGILANIIVKDANA